VKGAFSSSALYKLQLFGGVMAPFAAFVWENHASSKVQFFGWLVARGCVPAHRSLLRKGVLTPEEAVSPICVDPEETADHLFAGCFFTRSFWRGAPAFARCNCQALLVFFSVLLPDGVLARTAPIFTLLCYWQL
jgi:hypothetical protein